MLLLLCHFCEQITAENRNIIVIAAGRADALDTALRRAGRFDKEINITVPDETAREMILQVQMAGVRTREGQVDYKVGKWTAAYFFAFLISGE